MPRLPALPSRRLPIAVAKRFAGVPGHLLPAGLKRASEPQPGWFRLKLVRHGPWVPARIWWCDHEPGEPDNILDTGPVLMASLAEDAVDPLIVWERGQAIPQTEYEYRLKLRAWALDNDPDQPEAKPREAADLSALPSIF